MNLHEGEAAPPQMANKHKATSSVTEERFRRVNRFRAERKANDLPNDVQNMFQMILFCASCFGPEAGG
jgi:hypothetical protein